MTAQTLMRRAWHPHCGPQCGAGTEVEVEVKTDRTNNSAKRGTREMAQTVGGGRDGQ